MSVTLGLKVDYEIYRYYRYDMPPKDRDRIREILKRTFEQLVREARAKAGEQVQEQAKEQKIEVKVTQTLQVEESDMLRLYRRIKRLESELGKSIANLEEAKEELERVKSEREKCIQELEAIKKKPEALQKELQKKDVIVKELLELASLAAYCFETQKCDFSKALNILRNRLNKMGLEPIRISDVLLSLVTPK